MQTRPIKGYMSNDPMHVNVSLGDFIVTEKMRKYVNEVLDSGRISYGRLCRRFEEVFASIHASRFAVLSNSGTSSLQIALQTLKELHGWPDGAEVIIPSVTFVATVNACLHNRLKPVLVDVEPRYYCMDTFLLRHAITPNTVCILPIHPFGLPAEMTEINGIARSHSLLVIEDSCECMFVSEGNFSVGAWGEIGCFSTYAAHILNTGVGGISTTSNPDYAKHMRSLVNHGIDLTELPTGTEYDPTFLSRKFRFTSIGHSFRITELEAALGLAQLEDWVSILDRRQENAAYLTSFLSVASDKINIPTVRPDSEHSWMVYPIVVPDVPKEAMMNHLMVRGIESREMLPLTNQPCYSGRFNPTDYPVADFINRHGFYIGCHPGLTRPQLEYAAQEICTFAYEYQPNEQTDQETPRSFQKD